MNQRLGWKKMPVSVVQIHEGAKYRRRDRAEERHDTNIKKKKGGEIKKMNTKKGIAIGLAAVMISIIAACAVPMVGADTEVYTATVSAYGMDITVTANDLTFGTIQKGAASTITDSLTITNAGDKKATVEAKFTTQKSGGGDFGLTNGDDVNVIPASNFEIGKHLVALNNDGSAKTLGANNNIGKYKTVKYNAKLTVPNVESIPAADYSGTVELIFTAA